MKPAIAHHLEQVLGHLYINPLEKCNLRCAICYTRKTSPILSKEEILKFIDKYNQAHKLETITFCGGEVFTLPYFTGLVNELTARGIFVQMITNGTIDRLSEFKQPNSINLIVSLDGLPKYHDLNRGQGTFVTSFAFLKKAFSMGFHGEVFSIVTGQNFGKIDEFEKYLFKNLGREISVTYHPRKPPLYLMHHPKDNIVGQIAGFDFLNDEQMMNLFKNRQTFPPKNLGCYQVALVSDGRVFGCCEGVEAIGRIDDAPEILFKKLRDRLVLWEKSVKMKNCLGCSSPDFVCGIKRYLTLIN